MIIAWWVLFVLGLIDDAPLVMLVAIAGALGVFGL